MDVTHNNNNKGGDGVMTYPEAAGVLKINSKSVSQFITKWRVPRGKVLRNGRRIAVVCKRSLMEVVDRLGYNGPIDQNDVNWE